MLTRNDDTFRSARFNTGDAFNCFGFGWHRKGVGIASESSRNLCGNPADASVKVAQCQSRRFDRGPDMNKRKKFSHIVIFSWHWPKDVIY